MASCSALACELEGQILPPSFLIYYEILDNSGELSATIFPILQDLLAINQSLYMPMTRKVLGMQWWTT